MPAPITFLLVEGPHDAEFMACLLKGRGFEQRNFVSAIPELYRKLIPKDYPAKNDHGKEVPLTDPHPVPRFYQNAGSWVFILIGGGSKSAHTLAKALKDKALSFRDDALENAGLTADDLALYGKPGGLKEISRQKKAWVGAMGAVLMPSMAIQNSIRDNRWLAGEALALPRIQNVRRFIEDLLA